MEQIGQKDCMYVDERVGDKPNEKEREIERERERKKLGL